MRILPSDNSYRTFCDLTGGYRMFCVMTEAVRSGVIDALETKELTISELIKATSLRLEEGRRFVELLVNVGLLEQYNKLLGLSRFSRSFLSRSSVTCQRHVLEFEPVLLKNWQQLGVVLNEGQGALISDLSPEESSERLQLFQQAMSEAAQVRSRELWNEISIISECGTILDIGAGDGTYLKEFLSRHPGWHGIACDLPEVCEQNATGSVPHNLKYHPCNILESQALDALVSKYCKRVDLLLLSNICHCYSQAENQELLRRTTELLSDKGQLVVHDFYRDANVIGAIYDLHMLVNTYNGRCHSTVETTTMLENAGFRHYEVVELPSGSLAVVADQVATHQRATSFFRLKRYALSNGFFAAVELSPANISSEAWVRAKCAYGCSQYGRKWSCPPHALDQAGFSELLGCYSRSLLVAGQPPLATFQEHLLSLEKEAFLSGFKKALVFSGGPCCWCDVCDDSGCRFPEKRRPSLEACGCDVFTLAESCGIKIAPLRSGDDFVQYIGLLLVD